MPVALARLICSSTSMRHIRSSSCGKATDCTVGFLMSSAISSTSAGVIGKSCFMSESMKARSNMPTSFLQAAARAVRVGFEAVGLIHLRLLCCASPTSCGNRLGNQFMNATTVFMDTLAWIPVSRAKCEAKSAKQRVSGPVRACARTARRSVGFALVVFFCAFVTQQMSALQSPGAEHCHQSAHALVSWACSSRSLVSPLSPLRTAVAL
ncbi:hypothetical protein ATF69_0557 [Acidovorax delafieldii]|uniref:Uncharacterized protein n=1 Tax=Acidovorax delafieldii TaxID=47920 RepID=A0A561XRF1_ACIDE|nr:hypothetical protein ATF69_0557 [Acidovorax delafieldii]